MQHDTVRNCWCCLAFCMYVISRFPFFVLDKDSKKKALYFSDSNHYFCLEVEQATDNDTLNKFHLGHTFVDSNNWLSWKEG